MAFTNAKGQASIAGNTIYTCPASTVAVVIGFRVVNLDINNQHDLTASIGPQQVSPTDMILPPNGGYELTDGAKFVVNAGETITVSSDADTVIDVLVSILEQPA